MTITLTREEAQQVLDALGYGIDYVKSEETTNKQTYKGYEHLCPDDSYYIKFIDDAMETLRARLSAPEPNIVQDAIVYGTGITKDGKRIDPASIYKEPEPPCKTGSQCIGGKCPQCVVPEPVGWIYEDDEGRMMFSQMPTSALFWEPVYREKNNKGIE
jgi:hypothetical protein